MPARTPRQYRFMAAIASGATNTSKSSRKGVGPSVELAKEFVRKTPADLRKKWDAKR